MARMNFSKANFNAEETSDGAGNVQGSYSVALPDGRIQHVPQQTVQGGARHVWAYDPVQLLWQQVEGRVHTQPKSFS